MSTKPLDPRIFDDLKDRVEIGLASGELRTPEQIAQQTALFRDRFGPAVLRGLDGEALLKRMHDRKNEEGKCLAYWLEFKNDDEFAGDRFGGISGGSSLMYGIFQRSSDGEWVEGSPRQMRVLSLQEAIARARQQRDELLAGDAILASLDVSDPSDDSYTRLQNEMEIAAPKLSALAWAHKYWYLLHWDRLDDYHSPRYQRFHLFKLLQMPPDKAGVIDAWARFVCAGRFVGAARELGVPVDSLSRILNQRDGLIHRYWRVGTTGDGESHWAAMCDGGFVSIGWSKEVPDLSDLIGQDDAKEQIRNLLLPSYPTSAGTATAKANEIFNFAANIAENDLVVACDGQTVLGVGRVHGSYEYDRDLAFPHKRPVEWLMIDRWQMPEKKEGLMTTVKELGKSAENLLAIEQRLFSTSAPMRVAASASSVAGSAPLPPLDPFAARIETILRRKGQVVFYGPPGTGKTFRAVEVAHELAARQTFRKSFKALAESERERIVGGQGLVRICTFHPGYGYEDFVEGLRPKTNGGQMVFEPRDGIFKRLCEDAAGRPESFFLVVDEINRGDVPRIFGELMTVIERDKRGMAITLPVSGKSFAVPANVFLIGTMNTADRSISLLDAGLRRRFAFVELMPDSEVLAGQKAGTLPLGPWLDALNVRIRKNLKRDARNLQVGHAYLLSRPPITSAAEFARVLRDDIIPLLEEYCYDDFDTLKKILGGELVDAEAGRIKDELFGPKREEELIQAVSFEEMEAPVNDALTGDALDADEDQDAAAPAP